MTKRALLSVYDKSGIVEFARGLANLGWELVSSGGTAKALADAGLAVTDIADVTGVPAILGHRVVTLHPKVHGGLLADPGDASHVRDMEAYGIDAISLAVVNLYPFGQQPGIEMIDIGGPAMVRASAKNHAHVAVVVDPSDYPAVLADIGSGRLDLVARRRLARKAFAHTAAYDAAIVTWLDASSGDAELPPTLHLALEKATDLRYGENPHQRGARYRTSGTTSWWDGAVQHGGKEMSYLNVYDTEAAWRLVHRFVDTPAAVVVKHANPCGVAVADGIATAYQRAHACDPVSAFGGIVALNRTVTVEVAEALAPIFTEVVVAPGFDPEALAVLQAKKNLRLLSAPTPSAPALDYRTIDGGFLVQTTDSVSLDRTGWRVVSKRQPTEAEWTNLMFGWMVCAAVSSNAIVLANDGQAVGIGAGQQNRLDSARIAVEKAGSRAAGAICASDAFFPFRDGLDAVAASGAVAVIQPGGSIRDEDVIAAADEHGLAMVFTGERHFKH